mmetsp:Transcript_11782/g.10420  ORF Transcript_11782/g.10420 Transcript_11782/m.10420 type:complete len:144 (-) Transcript_11782:472-903(-)
MNFNKSIDNKDKKERSKGRWILLKDFVLSGIDFKQINSVSKKKLKKNKRNKRIYGSIKVNKSTKFSDRNSDLSQLNHSEDESEIGIISPTHSHNSEDFYKKVFSQPKKSQFNRLHHSRNETYKNKIQSSSFSMVHKPILMIKK